MRTSRYIPIVLAVVLAALCAASCSTTKRIPDGQVLYTGVKKFDIKPAEGEKVPGDVSADLKDIINVKPNNPFPMLSPYVRWPIPMGLWVYNNWNDSAGGLKGWLYKKLVAKPVLVSNVRPQTRVKMMKQVLDNDGYFNSTVDYALQYDPRNKKKARINYSVDLGKPYLIDSLIYLDNDALGVDRFIDSVARKNEYLQVGQRFIVDSLESVRVAIANSMRNRGYYYFRPEYIEFLADTLISPGGVTLKMVKAANTPDMALMKFKTGNVTVSLQRHGRGRRVKKWTDTIDTQKCLILVERPQHLRPNMIPSCITFRKGRPFSVRNMDRTQTRLARLGIFSDITIQPVPVDTSANPTLDVFVTCKYDQPIEASLEVNVTSKSNSYIGPGLVLGMTHHNLFGGAEKLTLKLNADYEWQTGRNRSKAFNSYEFGLNASLAFPRLLAPGFIRRTQRELNWSTFSLGTDLLNRPKYFKMWQWNAGVQYDWQYSRRVSNSFSPIKLTYTKLLSHTEEFDKIMESNPAIAQSFMTQFIPALSYGYTYDRTFDRKNNNSITFTAQVTEAGNLFWGIWRAAGVKGQKRLFGTPFSQFIKGQTQLVWRHRLIKGTDQWLVSRILVGAEHAYGNSNAVPYSEQFYIGGANSIRAFTVRSIGPGSYRSPADRINGYFDQTGTFKLEANVEYRFPIVSILHGAAFLDAGNIWLLRNDPGRPGGRLEGRTFLRDVALGTGVGLRVDLDMIVIRGDLGYALHAPYNTGHRGYFNMPFRKSFAFHLAIGYPF